MTLNLLKVDDVTGQRNVGKTDQPINTRTDESIISYWNILTSFFEVVACIDNAWISSIHHRYRRERNRSFLNLSENVCDEIAKAGCVANETSVVTCISCKSTFEQCFESGNPLECHSKKIPTCSYVTFLKTIEDDTKTPTLTHQELFFSLKELLLSSKFAAAEELDFESSFLIALATMRKLLNKPQYRCAADLISDVDETPRDLIDSETKVAKQTIVAEFYDLLKEVIVRWKRLTDRSPSDDVLTNPVVCLVKAEDPGQPLPTNAAQPAIDWQLETKRLYYLSRCKGCMLNSATHVILPCSELSICSSCLKSSNVCPRCKGPIETTIQTYT